MCALRLHGGRQVRWRHLPRLRIDVLEMWKMRISYYGPDAAGYLP